MGILLTCMEKNDLVEEGDVIIVVAGPPGVGKSLFINTATDSKQLQIGSSLELCTSGIDYIRIFDQDQCKHLVFVDTPGFDSDPNSQTKVETKLNSWLKRASKTDVKIAGILYLHRISDRRATEPPTHAHYRFFESLCGNQYHGKLLLVTTMWDKVEQEVGSRREEDLRRNFWDKLASGGSGMARHNNTRESARDVVKKLLASAA